MRRAAEYALRVARASVGVVLTLQEFMPSPCAILTARARDGHSYRASDRASELARVVDVTQIQGADGGPVETKIVNEFTSWGVTAAGAEVRMVWTGQIAAFMQDETRAIDLEGAFRSARPRRRSGKCFSLACRPKANGARVRPRGLTALNDFGVRSDKNRRQARRELGERTDLDGEGSGTAATPEMRSPTRNVRARLRESAAADQNRPSLTNPYCSTTMDFPVSTFVNRHLFTPVRT